MILDTMCKRDFASVESKNFSTVPKNLDADQEKADAYFDFDFF
jgi:hypothetical protein